MTDVRLRHKQAGLLLDEALIFERGSRRARRCRPAGRRAGSGDAFLPAELVREPIDGFPEVSEPEVLRHFLRLSQWNFGTATTFYPLGSCTMKYNPLANEVVARLPGFAALHPMAPDALRAGRAAARAGSCRRCWPRSAAWTRSRCSPPPARTASSPA